MSFHCLVSVIVHPGNEKTCLDFRQEHYIPQTYQRSCVQHVIKTSRLRGQLCKYSLRSDNTFCHVPVTEADIMNARTRMGCRFCEAARFHPEHRIRTLLGPFETRDAFTKACNTWSWNERAQSNGVFHMIRDKLQGPCEKVGEYSEVRCGKKKSHDCKCKFKYELALDGNYYLRSFSDLNHHGPGCLQSQPKNAVEKIAHGIHDIHEDMFYLASELKGYGIHTCKIHQILRMPSFFVWQGIRRI
jgi:hypothetical protein